MRLFVAVWPPYEVVNSIAALERPPLPGLRWTTPDQWHDTMRFLGDVDDGSVPALVAALPAMSAMVSATPTATMGPTTTRLGHHVLVAPVAGLDDVAAAVHEATLSLVPDDDRPRRFRGHVTLARSRRGASVPRSLAGTPLAGTWPVDRVTLVRSYLGPKGARYEIVEGA